MATEVRCERVEPDVLLGQPAQLVAIEFAAALSLAYVGPVGGAIAGTGEAVGLHEGLQQQRSIAVTSLPVVGQPAADARQHGGGEAVLPAGGQINCTGTGDETPDLVTGWYEYTAGMSFDKLGPLSHATASERFVPTRPGDYRPYAFCVSYGIYSEAKNLMGVSGSVTIRAAQGGGGMGEPVAPVTTPPDAVASVTVVHEGASLAVSWEAPARATHYDVTYSDADAIAWARAAWNRAGTSLTITCDVREGYEGQNCVEATKRYVVGVRARNAGGESAWVNSSPAAAPALSVADATAAEPGEGLSASLDFVVTLDRAAPGPVTVDYATADGTATAGSDYTATNGTLTFAAGDTQKTVAVPLLADAHDDGGETLTLTLSNASGARIADGEATGTITNDDPIPQAWLARFGRTVADEVLEAIEARMRSAPAPGAEVSVAGERLGLGEPAEARREAAARQEAQQLAAWLQGGTDSGGEHDRAPTPEELLTGSSFALTEQTASGGLVSLWGRGAVTDFDGREGD